MTAKEPAPCRFRAAYHEAGHVVMARELGMRIDEIRLPRDLGRRHASRFETLAEMYDLHSPNEREIRLTVRRYLKFLLAGPAAIMLMLEHDRGLTGLSPHRAGFRKRWLRSVIHKNDADIDYAYGLIAGWICFGEYTNVPEVFQQFWERAVEAFEHRSLWRRVERVANRLAADENSGDRQDA